MPSNLKRAKILIVDDQIANIDMLTGFLEMEGFVNMLYTTDPRKVTSLMEDFGPDIVLLDLMMPYISGYELLTAIRSSQSRDVYLPVLVLTADITSEAKRKALTLGANDFLHKPFDLNEVGLRINNLLMTRFAMLQLRDQNAILDEKVKARTMELEQKNLELLEAKEKAEAGNKLKTAFMQNISHEVRTPLNGILGFSKLIIDSAPRNIETEEYMGFLEHSANRLMNTITDYMDISEIAAGTITPALASFDIGPEMRELSDKYSGFARAKGLEFIFPVTGEHEHFIVRSDRSMIKKIFTHLIDNAIKFTSSGSVTVHYEVLPDELIFRVTDTGSGISPGAAETIFDCFIQENASITRGHEGSGLGLSIVNGFLNLLGGSISFTSEKGVGSEFYCKIPLA